MTEVLTYRPYQLEGIKHLLSFPYGQPHALLADGPGTGKTIQAIGAAIQSGCKSGVILVPAIAKQQWKRQMIKWGLCAEDEIQVLYGTNTTIGHQPWIVLNYDLVREAKIRTQINNRKFNCLIPDEAHRLKSFNSKTTLAVFHPSYGIAEQCYFKWPMSGSIMPNRPRELYCYFRNLAPEAIYPYLEWEDYANQFCGGMAIDGMGVTRRNVPELTQRLQRFMLRRELEDVWAECPELIENIYPIDVNYESHPEYIGDDFMEDATLRRVIAEAKIPQIVAYIKDRLSSGVRQLVCFTYHRKVLEACANELQEFNPLKINGGISAQKREESLAKFIENPLHRVFFLQIASAGEAIDGLQYASAEYVHVEPEWSYGREYQAGRRLLRLGQQAKTVFKTTLIAADSYEERIFNSNQSKRKVIEVVTKPNGGNFVMSIEKNIETLLQQNEQILQTLAVLKLNQPGPNAPGLPAMAAPAAAPMLPAASAPIAFPIGAHVPAPNAPFAGVPSPPANVFPQFPNAGAAAAPNAAPATLATSAPAMIAHAAPSNVDRKSLEDQIFAVFEPYGQQGFTRLSEEVKKLGVTRMSEIPETNLPGFLAYCRSLIPAAA